MRNRVNTEAEQNNPCLKEQKLSFECLNKNGFDQEKCERHFDNYNICKKFWGKVYKDRRARGIYPHLPEVAERAQIKEEYIKGQLGH